MTEAGRERKGSMAGLSNEKTETAASKQGTPKDKSCPYCGQAFTSSSLGRHLDLYIKERNPKPPDGIHDVDAIRKIRGCITRRQPRSSMGGRRDSSTPTCTPKSLANKELLLDRDSARAASFTSEDGRPPADNQPLTPRLDVTSVNNDTPFSREGDNAKDVTGKRTVGQRTASRLVVQKTQLDVRNKLTDAVDTARATELALREFLSSWRIARQEISSKPTPFDFDPLSLDFPALTLQCLSPPPTLFSSTQHPTATSWSVQSPGQRELGALQLYFNDKFREWRVVRAPDTNTSTGASASPNMLSLDTNETVNGASWTVDDLESQVKEHIESAYKAWDSLPSDRKTELWVLELARGIGRKQKMTDVLEAEKTKLKQENASLKAQINQLNRLQQSEEPKSHPTPTFNQETILHMLDSSFNIGPMAGVGQNGTDFDLDTIIAHSIERWKKVVAKTRSLTAGGMDAQRPLLEDAAAAMQSIHDSQPCGSVDSSRSPKRPQSTGIRQPSIALTRPSKAPHQRSSNSLASTTSSSANVSGDSERDADGDVDADGDADVDVVVAAEIDTVGEGERDADADPDPDDGDVDVDAEGDVDADAEMEDETSFPVSNILPFKAQAPLQSLPRALAVPRTRRHVSKGVREGGRFVLQNGTSAMSQKPLDLPRPIPNMNTLHTGALAMTVQGDDSMYLD